MAGAEDCDSVSVELIVSENVRVRVWPMLSVAFTVTVVAPAVLGAPEMAPPDELMPAGSPVMSHVTDAPPVVTNVWVG